MIKTFNCLPIEGNLKLKEKELKKYENEIILLINEILNINIALSN